MGSGDPSGLQNRREASLMSPVRSTRTRFRHFLWGSFDSPSLPLRVAQDFGARLRRRASASTSKPAGGISDVSGAFDSHTLPPFFGSRSCAPSTLRRQRLLPASHARA